MEIDSVDSSSTMEHPFAMGSHAVPDRSKRLSSANLDEVFIEEEKLTADSEDPSGRPGLRKSVAFKGVRHDVSRNTQSKEEITSRTLFVPWSKWYHWWWGGTVVASLLTVFTETYQIAFSSGGLYPYNDGSSIVEYILIAIFTVDIFINFNLAYFDEDDVVIMNRRAIARHYVRGLFWVDFIGVFPFYALLLAATGQLGKDSLLSEYLSLVRLLRMVRLHRVLILFERAQYSTVISLMWVTLLRNFLGALMWTHFNACIFYFIAKVYNFNEDSTWIAESTVESMTVFERYVVSLYWSVTTFATVGYGDYSPKNAAEQIWAMAFMLLNMTISAWFIGSITLLVVKSDERTGKYREALSTLDRYTKMHNFESGLVKRLRTQLKLDFHNREIADEQVLKNFPDALRRKCIRRLYLPTLLQTNLMKGIRQKFIDDFLSACRVELFSPGEEILQRGGTSNDLYLLVEGAVRLLPFDNPASFENNDNKRYRGQSDDGGSNADSDFTRSFHGAQGVEAGDFINDISFFIDSPQIDTVQAATICKTLTISHSVFQLLSQEHPNSVGKILNNLLEKVSNFAKVPRVNMPSNVVQHVAGSVYGDTSYHSVGGESSVHAMDVQHSILAARNQFSLSRLEDMIKMHINKQKDNETMRFLFAASRGDTATLTLMCDHGFDPDSADYDSRTALMVSSMNGHTDTVRLLLEYGANPNLTDMHGTSALYEATKCGNEEVMNELLRQGASLCMQESVAATVLCQAVFDGDIVKLRRLLQARIPVNASDYDKRAPVHIAAAEGNLPALKLLVGFGADLSVRDRWGNTAATEAMNANAGHVLAYFQATTSASNEEDPVD